MILILRSKIRDFLADLGTYNHIKFGSEAKTRAVMAQSSVKANLWGFDQVDKTACYTPGWRGNFFFSFDPI